MNKITIVEVNEINNYPPVQNEIRVLLDLGWSVDLISKNTNELPDEITNNPLFNAYELPVFDNKGLFQKIVNRIKVNAFVKNKTNESMKTSKYLWTTSIASIRILRKDVFRYKHIFQLMELVEHGYLFYGRIKFNLDKIAQNAYKVVVPEINRAYIEKIWWDLKTTPTVLPNKPYSLETNISDNKIKESIGIIMNEKRKIVLYLGGIHSDRNLESYAKAISEMKGYVLYIVGKPFNEIGEEYLKYLQSEYPVVYLGSFNPPNHLEFVKYAHIGLLPYKPEKTPISSELNALYCAPNKIYEYAGFGKPMIGSNVLGLIQPFEKWNIGFCCEDDSVKKIKDTIYKIDNNYETMSANCLNFFNSVDLHKIIKTIIDFEQTGE